MLTPTWLGWSLVAAKVGACSEDCSYCSQSSRYETEVQASPLMEKDEVVVHAPKGQIHYEILKISYE